jgi:hypothetical protein
MISTTTADGKYDAGGRPDIPKPATPHDKISIFTAPRVNAMRRRHQEMSLGRVRQASTVAPCGHINAMEKMAAG